MKDGSDHPYSVLPRPRLGLPSAEHESGFQHPDNRETAGSSDAARDLRLWHFVEVARILTMINEFCSVAATA
jgi:hypothetical protein